MAEKTFTIIKHRRGRTSEATGTLEELRQHFGYTLEAGNSYDPRVNLSPKTAKGLVSALNRAVESLQKGSFDPNHYELAQH